MSSDSLNKKRTATVAFGSGVAMFDDIRHRHECQKKQTEKAARLGALERLKADRAKKMKRDSDSGSGGSGSEKSGTKSAEKEQRDVDGDGDGENKESKKAEKNEEIASPATVTPNSSPNSESEKTSPPLGVAKSLLAGTKQIRSTTTPPVLRKAVARVIPKKITPATTRLSYGSAVESAPQKGVARVIRKPTDEKRKDTAPASEALDDGAVVPKEIAPVAAKATPVGLRKTGRRAFANVVEPPNRYQLSAPARGKGKA
jgi:hypothetical protein